jgi:hypothetical protein
MQELVQSSSSGPKVLMVFENCSSKCLGLHSTMLRAKHHVFHHQKQVSFDRRGLSNWCKLQISRYHGFQTGAATGNKMLQTRFITLGLKSDSSPDFSKL